MSSSTLVFKICPAQDWSDAEAAGVYSGSADDRRDGFIHFSTGEQLAGTAAKYFRGQTGLALVAFDAEALGPALKWEASRGGALFPHLYGDLDPRLAKWVRPLPLDNTGVPIVAATLRCREEGPRSC